MISESARMNSAEEARFRVQAPNSMPRAIKVIALDSLGDGAVRRLADGSWNQAAFFTASAFAGPASPEQPFSTDDWLHDLAGRTRKLTDEVDAADLVVMVAGPGGHAQVASIIGAACSLKRVMTTALLVGASSASDEALSKTLAQVRPWSLMVVIANADDYIEDMLLALRA
jgi:hypothetical protein